MNTSTPSARTAEIAFARESDERIAAAWSAYWAAMAPTAQHSSTIRDASKRLRSARTVESRSIWEARIEKARAAIAAIEADALPLAQAARDLDDELYTGWQRFYLVQHIHSSTSCSSFRPATKIGWLPDVSGLTEAEAVAEHGAILCTICFPSAPVEFTRGIQDDRCSGSGKPIDSSLPRRTGYYSGNTATCADCGKVLGVTRTAYRIPKHQALAVAEVAV